MDSLPSSTASKAGVAALAGYMALQAGQAFVQLPHAGSLSAPRTAAIGAQQQVPQQEARPLQSAATASTAAMCVMAAGSALAARSAKSSKKHAGVVACKSGKRSPGYNTLPEWDKPLNGFEGSVGDQPPLGLWDPLGFAADGDVEKFVRRRETEIKHGRVSMLATIGYIVPEYVRLPGELSPSEGLKFSDVPNGLAALSKVPAAGWAQIVAFVAFLELGYNKKYPEPGNYGKGFLGLGSLGLQATLQDPEKREKKLAAELANGRLAMMAIIGMFFQDGLTGSAWGDWANYTASPLRAFGSDLDSMKGRQASAVICQSGKRSPGYNTLPEWDKPRNGFEGAIGDQAPLGLWDPLGFSADGDVEKFVRRRETEIKHGRVSMLATIGYIVPEYVRLPGELSPSEGLKFSDIPNGLAALSKVPVAGWGQIVAFVAFVELVYNKKYPEPGNFGKGFLGLGSVGFQANIQDPEKREKKLAAELANGRLAMVAIIGMFFQDGLTGSAWGDWANYTDSPLRAFENELGVQAPLGFWDPMGFSSDGDVAGFARRRETEIKHGRVAMYATMGYMVPEYYKFPGFLAPSLNLKFEDVPNGLGACSKVPSEGWLQVILFAGCYEAWNGYDAYKRGGTPGEYGDGAGSIWKYVTQGDANLRKRKLNAELANGRLAMMAIIGMFYQDGLTGQAWGDWSLYTDSPLRAFESELGVQAPVGFWDPAGFCKDGNTEVFARRRETELKHGRVCMIACIGYMVPEYFKWPGYCSPSQGIRFEDIPNGLAAIAKVPSFGWTQMVAFAAFLELSYFKYDPARGAGNYANGGILGVPGGSGPMPDAEARQKRLSAELANGRLAMVAIIGMFFQDGLTGAAWGDWALYTDSPLRAVDFSKELGACPPVGFWDPLQLSQFDDPTLGAEVFRRRRTVEIQHGRVSMLACIGYIVPEYFRWPGFVSPSEKLAFADIPNGLAAWNAVPAVGWWQMIGFVGIIEVSNLSSAGGKEYAGDYDGYGAFGIPRGGGIADKEKKEKSLLAEINNGRLAMMAIIGMMFQDGLTGSAWGDWSLYNDSPLR